jgi:integrating conjugative element protein (TIGR03761 family)
MVNENITKMIDQPTSLAKLNSEIKMTLHTRIAQSLFNGSWKHGRMGLLQFAKVMTALWNAYSEDDPYAELYILKTYQNLMEAREKIKSFESVLNPMLSNLRGIEVTECLSTNPTVHPLTFATPFGFMGAYLIADADYVIRLILTLERLGISINNEEISIKGITKYIQDVFSTPRGWKRTQITRSDIKLNNEKAKLVKEQLGEVPLSILEKKIDFAFLPKKLKESINEG